MSKVINVNTPAGSVPVTIEQMQFDRSINVGAVPSAAQMKEGGIAINLPDRKIYSKDELGNVIKVGQNYDTEIGDLQSQLDNMGAGSVNPAFDTAGRVERLRATISADKELVGILDANWNGTYVKSATTPRNTVGEPMGRMVKLAENKFVHIGNDWGTLRIANIKVNANGTVAYANGPGTYNHTVNERLPSCVVLDADHYATIAHDGSTQRVLAFSHLSPGTAPVLVSSFDTEIATTAVVSLISVAGRIYLMQWEDPVWTLTEYSWDGINFKQLTKTVTTSNIQESSYPPVVPFHWGNNVGLIGRHGADGDDVHIEIFEFSELGTYLGCYDTLLKDFALDANLQWSSKVSWIEPVSDDVFIAFLSAEEASYVNASAAHSMYAYLCKKDGSAVTVLDELKVNDWDNGWKTDAVNGVAVTRVSENQYFWIEERHNDVTDAWDIAAHIISVDQDTDTLSIDRDVWLPGADAWTFSVANLYDGRLLIQATNGDAGWNGLYTVSVPRLTSSSWLPEFETWADKVPVEPDVGTITTFTQLGALVVNVGSKRWYPMKDISIRKIDAFVSVAPTGAPLIATIRKNGLTLHTVNIPSGESRSVVYDVSYAMTMNDYITVDIDQVGAAEAGYDLNVRLLF